MNEDRSLDQYFQTRVATIDVPPREAATIAARARQRRHTRRSRLVFGTAALVLVGAVAVVAGGSRNQSVNTAGVPTSSASLSWSVVDVPAGLGWSTETVAADDGSLYSLSTSPGPSDPNDTTVRPPVLYRSSDGKAWTTASLPSGLSATALATSGGHLYAVGTAAAGGGSDLVVASSADGAATWTTSRIPSPRADLVARFGGEIEVSSPTVTSGPKGLVAAVTVVARPDVDALLAAHGDSGKPFATSATGVDVYRANGPAMTGKAACLANPSTTVPGADATTNQTVPDSVCGKETPEVDHSYTWAQLGLDPALQALLGGEAHVYASADGSTFDEVGRPDGANATVGALIGGADGYRMLMYDRLGSVLHPYWSPDGRTWTSSGADVDGMVQTSGLLAGSPAAVIEGHAGSSLLLAAPGGGWTSSDLLAATGANGSSAVGLSSASIGPLGLVATFADGGVDNDAYVVDSADGRTFDRHRLSEIDGGGDWSTTGSSVSADAVTLRLVPALKPGADPATLPVGPQRLVVGTRP